MVPWLWLAFRECLNFTSAPPRPQEDPLLFKMQSRGKVGFWPILPPSSLSSSSFCRLLSSLASALVRQRRPRLSTMAHGCGPYVCGLIFLPQTPRSPEGTGWHTAGLGGARRTCIGRQVLHSILLTSLPRAGPAWGGEKVDCCEQMFSCHQPTASRSIKTPKETFCFEAWSQ